eukprot:75201-Alexandrium_andersonii.AAC.1
MYPRGPRAEADSDRGLPHGGRRPEPARPQLSRVGGICAFAFPMGWPLLAAIVLRIPEMEVSELAASARDVERSRRPITLRSVSVRDRFRCLRGARRLTSKQGPEGAPGLAAAHRLAPAARRPHHEGVQGGGQHDRAEDCRSVQEREEGPGNQQHSELARAVLFSHKRISLLERQDGVANQQRNWFLGPGPHRLSGPQRGPQEPHGGPHPHGDALPAGHGGALGGRLFEGAKAAVQMQACSEPGGPGWRPCRRVGL